MPEYPILPNIFLRILEPFYLLGLNIVNTLYNFAIYLQEIWLFYPNRRIRQFEYYWHQSYLLQSPFQISHKARQQNHLKETLTIYGETPWTTMKNILDHIPLSEDDIFVELGCGTGRNLGFVHLYYGISTIGFELVSQFVQKARWIFKKMGWSFQVQIHEQNWFDIPISEGNIFYITGTCYEDADIEIMRHKIREFPSGAHIITVSYPLESELLELQRQVEYPFSWGKGTVYFHQKIV